MFFSNDDCELFNEENKYSLDKKICEKRQILHKKLWRCYTENDYLMPFSDEAIENTDYGIAQMIIDDFSLLIRLFNFIKIPNTTNAKRK